MCGRYTLTNPAAVKAALARIGVKMEDWMELPKSYNVPPTRRMPIVKGTQPAAVALESWGVWRESGPVHDRKLRFLSNARADSASRPGVWSDDVQHRRCLVPADGFFEWHTDERKVKTPFWIRMKDGAPFWFAGLYGPSEGGKPDGYSLMTTEPNDVMQPIHDRMPVILADARALEWLAPGAIPKDKLREMTASYPADQMIATQVSTVVNSSRNDVPECVLPVGHGELF